MAVGGFDHFSTGGAKIICLRSMTLLHHNDVIGRHANVSTVTRFQGTRSPLSRPYYIRCDDGRNDYIHTHHFNHSFRREDFLSTHTNVLRLRAFGIT